MMNVCTLLLACTALQTPSVAPAENAKPDWFEFDRVVAIVNQDIITYRQLMRDLAREKERHTISNKSELQATQTRILTRRVKSLLSKQAGQDMGADEKLVERNVQDSFERIIANNNGVVGMSKVMKTQDMNTQDVKEVLREELYTRIFEDSVTGEGSGLAARPNRDRYVRPGEMKFRYQSALRRPELLQYIGGSQETVSLQTISLDSDKRGGRDATLALGHELAEQLRGEADMGELVRKYSAATENDGVNPPAELTRLRSLAPGLAKFVDDRPGDATLWPKYISEPIVVSDTGTRMMVLVARIKEITPGETPVLESTHSQEQIAKYARESLDDYRLERAFVKLHAAAYIWPPEYAAPQKH
jgi:hypothetical protein